MLCTVDAVNLSLNAQTVINNIS